jgi:1,4-dihydroxy-6-naphthoate synthase
MVAPQRSETKVVIRIGHSPDPDDAFMFYALTAGKIRRPGIEVVHVLEDIESLNRRAQTGELEVTAVSAASYPRIASRYRLMDPGASMGKGYGPILVAREPLDPRSLGSRVVAIPGPLTTAALLLQLYCEELSTISVQFDEIPQAVLDGRADLGLLIHEGQITHHALGLHKVLDLGERWQQETSLPLPLGVNVMRRDLGEGTHRTLSAALRESIAYAHTNVDAALDYALTFGRGIDRETCRRFVLMYVNEYTVALGPAGRQALKYLYTRAQHVGAIAAAPPIDPV